ncbi:MAG: hypothetical protein IJU70_07230 [Lentisphaeria bacterium]|nr:hypothetical protein [Lentisphaeria bacterium]
MKKLFPEHNEKTPARTAVLLSGGGSNAEALLRYCGGGDRAFAVKVLVTDDPRSRASEIARGFGLPAVLLDLRAFYAEHGENSIRLDSPVRRELRAAWSGQLRRELAGYGIELVLFAGFIPMTNLAAELPCLNVHPGDLTAVSPDGRRIFAGLHCKPVEDALCRGEKTLRSSVILAQPYSGDGRNDMDSGPVIGVSPEIPVEIAPDTPETLSALRAARTGRPDDRLRRLAASHIEKMKRLGDHVIFSPAAEDFSRGRFALDDGGGLLYDCGGQWVSVLSVEYSKDGAKPIPNRKDGGK